MSTAEVAMMRGGDNGMYGAVVGWFGLLGLLLLALTALAVVASVWLIKHFNSGRASGHEDLLSQRYAAGEIYRETYLRMRDDLAVRG